MQTRRFIPAVLAILLMTPALPGMAQHHGWQNFTSSNNTYYSMVSQDSILWLGSSDGLLMFNKTTQEDPALQQRQCRAARQSGQQPLPRRARNTLADHRWDRPREKRGRTV